MSWKRLRKGCNSVGKSIESEGKRVTEKIAKECIRFVEGQADTQSEQLDSIVEQSVCSEIDPPTKNTTCHETTVNPEYLKPGRAYIINHLSFNDSNLRPRLGSEFDVERLRRVFEQFGMQIEHVHDGTLADIRCVMEKIAEYDFRTLSCLVIIIMSHGHEGNIIAAKDGEYSLDYDIMYPILRNRSLTSKLKLIVTQACKGPVDPLLEIEGPRKRPTAIPSEILQVNSCVEGYVSYLHPTQGSVFIATLCDHLERSGRKEDIRDIANAVVADVKKKYFDIQIPMVLSNLTKNFVFGHYTMDS